MTGGGTTIFTTVGLNTWIVPSDWNSGNNLFECIGGGGGGTTTTSAGGGGGGYASSVNLTLTPGQMVWIMVGQQALYQAKPANAPTRTNTRTKNVLIQQASSNSWINISGNFQPVSASQGICATGGGTGDSYFAGGAGGSGIVGNHILTNGGNGCGENIFLILGGAGGGAGGPHGAGVSPNSGNEYGGAGDAGYGGAGGTPTSFYQIINDGQNGANNGSGGGGADDSAYSPAGLGGLYGGGGAGNRGGSQGAPGICKITYFPYIAAANTPSLPPPANTTPPPACVPSGFNTATPAQIYWDYGTWSDPWNNVSSAHYDTNYKLLLALQSDNDTGTYDIQYNNTQPWNIMNEQENFYSDYPRIWKSRSNEWVDDGGTQSVWMRHRTIIGDTDCVPNIDQPSGYVTLLQNQLFMDEQTYGYRLAYTSNFGYFNPGDLITQTVNSSVTVSGVVYMMDPTFIYVNVPVGGFVSGQTVTGATNSAINAYVSFSTEMNEKYSANVFPGQSRYITKYTLLPTKQSAEDLQVFMTAYRPGNTNFKVYGKISNKTDPNQYFDRIWSRLTENTSSVASFSSLTNPQDFVLINYDFPASQLIFANLASCGCANNSLNVTVPHVDYFFAGQYIYLSSPGQGTFNVRQIINIPNNSTLAISSYPSFSNTANLNVGMINGLEDLSGAFLYDQNDYIVRYGSNNDIYYDTFNQFAIKVVPISDNPVVCPTVTEFRAVAITL